MIILSVVKYILPNLQQQAKNSGSIQLVTISVSHFCELACWALKIGGISYQEHHYAPVQHVFAAYPIRIPDKDTKYLSKTSKVETVGKEVDPKKDDSKGRSSNVPVAVCPDGTVLVDSWEIASKSGLKDIDPELKKILDEDIGPLARQMAYSYLLKPSNVYLFEKLCCEGRHWSWRLAWYLFLGNFTIKIMRKIMKPNDIAECIKCKERLEVQFKNLDKLISEKRTPYLGGEKIGLADIAVASLIGPLVNPPEYIGGKAAHIFDELMRVDKECGDNINHWRETVVGKYVLKMYKDHRL
eukprot:gene6192-8529_t